jgi:hypothetical protein
MTRSAGGRQLRGPERKRYREPWQAPTPRQAIRTVVRYGRYRELREVPVPPAGQATRANRRPGHDGRRTKPPAPGRQ